jgi:hypothetical protein
MEIGMLWYDDSPIALKDRVVQAAGYYSEKYGRKPNLCLVHPDMLQAEEGKANGVMIRKGKGVMPGHFWIGVDEVQQKPSENGKRSKGNSKQAAPKAEAKSTTKAKAKPTTKAKAKTTTKARAKTTTKARAKSTVKPKSATKATAKSATKSTAKSKSKTSATKKSKPAAAKTKAEAAKRIPVVLKKKSGRRVEKSSKKS